jgi:RNA polymerase subunit RPABC4/transcription elongation factor Spt4
MPFRNEDNDRLSPEEYPEPDESSTDTVACPHCRAQVYDDSEHCPACGHYLSADSEGKPEWMIVGILVCLGVAIGWVIWG